MKKYPFGIKDLFEPEGVAIIGASRIPGKVGYKLIENVVTSGYQGGIYPVNRNGGEILGLKVHTSIKTIGSRVDIAIISIPAKHVLDSVKECGEIGVKFLIIITSGFAEVGNIEGERRILEEARKYGMRVLGPNIFGIYSSKVDLNATFGPANIKKGNISIITQSGALGIAMIGKTATENLGLSSMISVGNKSDINESDLLDYLSEDDDTKVILIYIEGVKDGRRLMSSLKAASRKKHVIVLKSGRSKKGAMAAASHTGSLAGEDIVFDDIMKQCGVLRAVSIEEAFNWCRFLSESTMPKGENVVIITNGGGIGVLATDACETYNVNLYDNYRVLDSTFKEVVPSFGSAKNPIDLTGQATDMDYIRSLRKALETDEIHGVIALYCETAMFNIEKTVELMATAYGEYRNKKPIIFSAFGGEMIKDAIGRLTAMNVSVFDDVYNSVSCLGALYRRYRYMNRKEHPEIESDIDMDTIRGIVRAALDEDKRFLLAPEAQELLKAAGIPGARSITVKNIQDAVATSKEIGYPVVLKIVSRDITHKSDAGGVALDLMNDDEVMDGYQAVMRNCKTYMDNAKIEGVEVCKMIPKDTETIIGGRKDKTFGPIVMFGLGGIYVEVMKDITFRAYPIDRLEVMDMVKGIRTYPILLGVRGEEMKDIEKIMDTIIKVGMLIDQIDEISDIEINPLMVYPQGEGAIAVDARILLNDEKRGDQI